MTSWIPMNGAPYIYQKLFTWISFCLLYQMLGAGGDASTRQVLPARQVMFSSIVGHLIVIGIVALSVHIIRSDIATKLASGNGFLGTVDVRKET